ncbi:hypothetical protein KQH54_00570 [bacterium]|nr:hypothetical protein [bacterium]
MTVLVILLGLAAIFTFVSGVRTIRQSQRLTYYRLRRSRLIFGWRMVFISLGLIGITFLVNQFGEPLAYSVYTVSPTPSPVPTATLTPTITETPTITLTPTITPTLSESYTPTPSPTPHVPLAVEAQFSASITPPASSLFSPLTFATGLDAYYNPISPGTSFTNPVGHLYAIFSYDGMSDGAQWTALWFRDSELVYFETQVWAGGTGGLGYTDWDPDPTEWEPGLYTVQIFVGLDFKVGADFEVVGMPATATFTSTLTPTQTYTTTPTLTPTRTITLTPTPTKTRWPTHTPTFTLTPRPTLTPAP